MMLEKSDVAQHLAGVINPDPAQFLTMEEADLVTYYRNCSLATKQQIHRLALKCCSDELERMEASTPGIFPGYIQRGGAA